MDPTPNALDEGDPAVRATEPADLVVAWEKSMRSRMQKGTPAPTGAKCLRRSES